jgi:hypothetical protein
MVIRFELPESPYVASKERSAQIRRNYTSIQIGMTPQQVKRILGDPVVALPQNSWVVEEISRPITT